MGRPWLGGSAAFGHWDLGHMTPLRGDATSAQEAPEPQIPGGHGKGGSIGGRIGS